MESQRLIHGESALGRNRATNHNHRENRIDPEVRGRGESYLMGLRGPAMVSLIFRKDWQRFGYEVQWGAHQRSLQWELRTHLGGSSQR